MSWRQQRALLAGLDAATLQQHEERMRQAIALAEQAGLAGDVPVGAVLVDGTGRVLATGENRKERDRDPTAHAELLAIRAAARQLGDWRLEHCTLYVTLEPCPMCAGVIVHARVPLLVYGADDPKTGAIRTAIDLPDSPASNHNLAVLGGILERECREQLRAWFARRRS